MSLDEYVYHLSLDVLSKEIGKYDASKLNEIYISHFNSEFFFFFFFFFFFGELECKKPKFNIVDCFEFFFVSWHLGRSTAQRNPWCSVFYFILRSGQKIIIQSKSRSIRK